MHRQHLGTLFSLVILLIFIASLGCSVTRSVVQKIKPDKPFLKKRVMVLPLIDNAGIGSARTLQITETLIDLLTKSSHLKLYKPPRSISVTSELISPEFGIVANTELAKKAEGLRMDVLITGVLNPIETRIQETGIWPFKESRKIYEISVDINAMDTVSKTLLLTQFESEKESVPLDEFRKQDEEVLLDKVLGRAMLRVLEREAAVVASRLEEEPWTGRILAADDNTITINAGKDVGLQPGYRFDVFARGESISSSSGTSFNLLGEKIGEIEAASIMEKDSLAVVVEDGPFLAGQVIKVVP